MDGLRQITKCFRRPNREANYMNVQEQSWQSTELKRVPLALAGHDVPWVRNARLSAFKHFARHGFPTRREEEWKYTDVLALSKRASLAPDNIPPNPSSEAALYAWLLAQENVHLMVFVNGHYDSDLSAIDSLPSGVQLESLADMLDDSSCISKKIFTQRRRHTIFSSLNTALTTDGAVLKLAPGVVPDKPIYLLFIASGHGAAIYPRNIIIAGANSRATVVEHYLGMIGAHNFTNAVTQLSLGAHADIVHYKLQLEGSAAYHIAGIHTEQATGSRFVSHSFTLGGRLTRNDITTSMSGSGCHCTLNGLYMLDGKQHVDNHTRIDHLAPSCTSSEYYRGILDGESRGVFNGKVIVHPNATKTDVNQSNHNLLLSRQAEVDTKPQLEIFADDVKCTQDATVGQLDENSLFYLRARGIDAELAKSMLVYGFAFEITSKISVPELRNRIEHLVLDRLPQGEQIKELL